MKGNKSLSIFLIALMAFGMLMVTVPPVPAYPTLPPIVIDGGIDDWDFIQPLSVPGSGELETTGDTEAWSVVDNPTNDKARDLKALYMWLQDSGDISIRLDVLDLYAGWEYGAGNAAVYHIYFDTDDDHTTGASAGLNSCDITAIGWERMLYFDGTTGFVMDNTSTVLAEWPGGLGGLDIAVNVDLGVMEFAIDRSQASMAGLTIVSVSVFSFKPGVAPAVFDVTGGDLADEIPNGVTSGDHSTVLAGADLRTDMSENAKIHLVDAATGKQNITEYDYLDTFTLNITVEDFVDVSAYAIGLTWDKDILDCTGWTTLYDFFGPIGDIIAVPGTINNTAGKVYPPYGVTDTAGGITGDGVLAQVDFVVTTDKLAKGTWIELNIEGLSDFIASDDITMPIKNAHLYIPAPPEAPPTASFTESASFGYANDTVFDFTDTSTAGTNGTHTIPITGWFWDFGDGENSTVQDPSHVFVLPGIYTVNLTITDALGRTAWKTATKNVVEMPLGDVIDAYTEWERAYGYYAGTIGEGLNQTADEYQIDENVTLFANVTHNDWPLQERLVAWQVWRGDGELVLVDTTMTNASGIATITFRIATICGDREEAWGKWKVLAKTSIAKNPINDTLWFSVGDYIDLLSIETLPEWAVGDPQGDHINFTITLINIAQLPRNVTLVIQMYDDLGVPVAYVIWVLTIEGGEWCNPNVEVLELDCITIPKWAYVGPSAILRVSAYTKLPSECGVPWCEAVEMQFSIVVP